MRAGTVTVTPCDSKGTWLVMLHGEHDLATRLLLDEQTRAIWPLCTVAVVDLSEATFVDSGVIRWLMSVERELAEAGTFTLSYGGAMVVAVACGAAWDLSGRPALAFLPLAVCALALAVSAMVLRAKGSLS